MEKLMEKISAFIEPVSEWVHRMKFLNAIAEVMQLLLPVIVIGSFACLFAFLDVGPWQSFLAANPIVMTSFQNAQGLTLSIISFYVVLTLPYLYAKRLEMDEPMAVVPLAVAAFFLLTPTELYTAIPTAWLGHQGMFSAFIIVFLVTRFVKICQDHNITIKMPQGVPHYIEATFAVLIPAVVIIFGCSFIGQALAQTSFGSIHQLIYSFIQTPLSGLGTSFIGLLITELVMTLAMFCGIHGSSVVPFMNALMLQCDEANAAAIAAGQSIPYIYSTGLCNTIQMGGIGATLGFGILLFIFAKSKRYRQLSKVAIVPQIFNIGEPLLFGVPIMLNPLLFIPYMGGAIINTCIVWGSVAIGFVGRYNGVNPSWTLPGPIQALLTSTTPVQAFIVAILVILVDMAIWYPFMKMVDKQVVQEEMAAEAN